MVQNGLLASTGNGRNPSIGESNLPASFNREICYPHPV